MIWIGAALLIWGVASLILGVLIGKGLKRVREWNGDHDEEGGREEASGSGSGELKEAA